MSAGNITGIVKEQTKEQDIVVSPKRHDNPCGLVQDDCFHVAQPTGFPDADLSIAHFTETGRGDPTKVAHPSDSGTFHTAMTICDPNGLSSSPRVKETELAVPTSSCEHRACWIERNTLDGIAMSTQDRSRILCFGQIPKFDSVFARGRR